MAISPGAWATALWTPDSGGNIPAGSYIAGQDFYGNLRACRAIQPVTGAQIVGVVGPLGCRVVRGLATGNEISSYEVLELPDPSHWVTGWTGVGLAGGTTSGGNAMYVCRLLVGNDKIPGKYLTGKAACYAWPNGGAVITSANYPFETLTACTTASEASAIPDSGGFTAGGGHIDSFIWQPRSAMVKSWLSSNGYLSTPGNPVAFQSCANVPKFSFSNYHFSELKKALKGVCACQ